MEKVFFLGEEIDFRDLLEETQKKIYLKNKEKIKAEAARSQFFEIRAMVAEDESTSNKILNQMILNEIEGEEEEKIIKIILNNPNFKMEENIIEILANSKDNTWRKMLVEYKGSSSELLNQIFRKEIEGQEDEEVIEAILDNPKFKMEEKNIEVLAKLDDCDVRLILAEYEGNSTEMLNQMLLKEIEGQKDESVIEAILDNPKFKMEEKTIEVLAKSDDCNVRLILAGYEETSTEMLNQMLRDELKGQQETDIIGTILDNTKFKMEEETRKVLAGLDNWYARQIVAEDEGTSTEMLNQMLRDEFEGEDDADVRYAILNNSNFEMEEETRKMFAKSDDFDDRRMVAEDKGTSAELLTQMYENEIKGKKNKDLIYAILTNPNFAFK